MSKETSKHEENIRKATQIISDLESRTCTFTKTYKVHGKNKTGTFSFKYPSLIDRTHIGIARAKMLDGAPEHSLDRLTSDLTYMIAYIGKLCIKQPKWFNLNMIDEVDVINDLFTEVSNWVVSFRRELERSEDARDSHTTDDEDDMDGNETI